MLGVFRSSRSGFYAIWPSSFVRLIAVFGLSFFALGASVNTDIDCPTEMKTRAGGYAETLSRFSRLIKKETPSARPLDPNESLRRDLVTEAKIDGIDDNPDETAVGLVIGLNQRLQSYIKEGTTPRDPVESFGTVFSNIDEISEKARHVILFGEGERIYQPEEFAYFPENFRPQKPFRFRVVLGFGRIEKYDRKNPNSLTLNRDLGRDVFQSDEFNGYLRIVEISRMNLVTKNPIAILALTTKLVNTALALREPSQMDQSVDDEDLKKYLIVCSVYDELHRRLWNGQWGFVGRKDFSHLRMLKGGETSVLTIHGDQLQENLERKTTELFERESELVAARIQGVNAENSKDPAKLLIGKVIYKNEQDPRYSIFVKVEAGHKGEPHLVAYLDNKDGRLPIRGRAEIDGEVVHHPENLSPIEILQITLNLSFSGARIKTYKSKSYYPIFAGSLEAKRNMIGFYFTLSTNKIENPNFNYGRWYLPIEGVIVPNELRRISETSYPTRGLWYFDEHYQPQVIIDGAAQSAFTETMLQNKDNAKIAEAKGYRHPYLGLNLHAFYLKGLPQLPQPSNFDIRMEDYLSNTRVESPSVLLPLWFRMRTSIPWQIINEMPK